MKRRGIISLALFLIVFSMPISALTTFPTSTEIDNHDKEQTLVLTILNDGPRTEQIRMIFDPYSSYLMEYVTLEPAMFNLSPNSRKNVELTFRFPQDLSPETHTLILTPVTDKDMGTSSTFSFTVPGVAKHDLEIESVTAEDIMTDESLIIDLALYNRGNVIARAYPKIEIWNDTELIDMIEYKSMVMIMPYSRYDLSLRHDFLNPIPGNFTIQTTVSYNDRQLETGLTSTTFSIISEEVESAESFGWAYLLFGAGVLVIVLFIIFQFHSPSEGINKERRIILLKKKIILLEKELSGMVKETENFIHSSNRWMRPRFGEHYEFR